MFTHEAMLELMSHSWPGNIRQLKNSVLKLLLDPEIGNVIDAKDVLRLNEVAAQRINEHSSLIEMEREDSSMPLTLAQADRLVIIDHIRAFPKESIALLAKRLKISRPTLTAMIRRYSIDVLLERAKGLKKLP